MSACANGHRVDDVYISPRGYAQCRACRRDAVKRWQAKNPDRVRGYNRAYMARRREKEREAVA